MSNPQKWWQIYQGDKECRLFKALARGGYEWRTTEALMKSARLTQQEVETICSKYSQSNIVHQHSKDPNKWRYWENATTVKEIKTSIAEENKNQRIKEKIDGKSQTGSNSQPQSQAPNPTANSVP